MKINLSLSRAVSIPLLLLNIIFSVVLSFYLYTAFERINNDNIKKLYNENLNLFSSLVSQDIIMGQYASVEKKCNQYFDQNSVNYIQILTDEFIICKSGTEVSNGEVLKKTLFFDEQKKEVLAEIVLGYHVKKGFISETGPLLVFLGISFVILTFVTNHYLIRIVIRPLQKVTKSLSGVVNVEQAKEDIYYRDQILQIDELKSLFENRNELLFQLKSYQDEQIKNAENKIVVEVARQVAHDIRSPLAALDMAVNELKGLESGRFNLIKTALERIRSIANNMHQKTRELVFSESEVSLSKFIVHDLLVDIIEEKKLEFMSLTDLEIEYEHNNFVETELLLGDSSEYKRVFSNIINNSVEALKEAKGKVSIKLDFDERFLYLNISDSGQGISEDKMSKIFEKNYTSGKDNGTGLGLHYAREIISKSGGNIFVSSVVDEGTQLSISIPRLKKKYVLIDDDELIRLTWESAAKSKSVEFYSFSSCIDFEKSLDSLGSDFTLYIDSSLSDDVKGEIKAKEYFELGISEIYLTTGFEKSSFEQMSWIKRIVPKDPPWV
ncbi:putative two-component sensor kinase [Halobacteriovorax marinus SJ]|uniref:histidine kinase n=1 Tax=Halobacteriovorax marinus (strain ATCC BAA-682 / DSM 15412 / SJ) TaxID=862908 RepID=E1WZZ1_HALMS|nr:HAMP domain-containing sensor histidine kinase [Halobacteriovorax marinus]CBW27927.1 putative two-component sensor kinase [Halobacteriovorax marinus SJ]